MRYHPQMLGQTMPMHVPRNRQRRGRLRDARTQRHMRTTYIVMLHPCCQKTPEMVCGEWNQKVHALSPQGADEPLAEGIGLRRPDRRLAHPHPQVADALVQLLREDTITIMNQEAVGMVSGNRFAQLLQGPRRCRGRRDIDRYDAACGMFHDDEHIEEAKGRRDHDTEITRHDRLGMVPYKGLPALRRHAFPSFRVQALRQIFAYGAWR